MEKRTLLEARLQQLFYKWLLLPETQHLVESLKFDKTIGSQAYRNPVKIFVSSNTKI
jgi:hypothetical protein